MSRERMPHLALVQTPRRKLAETVAEQLVEAIGSLEPGARLPSEKELMQSLGVGRSTVREALNGLALLGLIEIRHGQGAFVAAESPKEDVSSDATEALALALAKGVTRDLLEVRQIVEVAIAGFAAQRRTDAELRELEAELQAYQRAVAVGQNPGKHGTRFHVLLAEAAHNEVLAGVFQSFRKLMAERGPRLYEELEGFTTWELEQHQRLYEAIRDGDAELAALRMEEHVRAMETHYRHVGEV